MLTFTPWYTGRCCKQEKWLQNKERLDSARMQFKTPIKKVPINKAPGDP